MRAATILRQLPPSPFVQPSVFAASRQVTPIDGTWFMPNVKRDAHAEFERRRIPGARFFDLDAVSDRSSPFPHMLPSAATFALEMGKLGIRGTDDLCIYDSHGLFSAARVYWTFRVFGHRGKLEILRGGMPAYEAAGLPISTEAPEAPQRTDYGPCELREDMVASFDDIVAIGKGTDGRGGHQILDARPGPRFTGAAPEPRQGLSSGHMPGSTSLPFPEVLDATGALLESAELRAVLERRGIALDRPLVVSCGSGVTACILGVALHELGVDAQVYDESWTGYADDSRAGKLPGMIVKD